MLTNSKTKLLLCLLLLCTDNKQTMTKTINRGSYHNPADDHCAKNGKWCWIYLKEKQNPIIKQVITCGEWVAVASKLTNSFQVNSTT